MPDAPTSRAATPLDATPLFAGLPAEVRAHLEATCQRRHVAGGEIVFRQGAAADWMYVLLRGRLEVVLERPGGEERLIDTVWPGGTVGEQGLLLDEPRSATVVAARDSVLLRIDRPTFEALVSAHPSVAMAIARQLSQRLKRTTRGGGGLSRPHSIAVLPLSLSIDAREVAGRLCTALRRTLETAAPEAVALVTLGDVASAFPEAVPSDLATGDASARASEWISELEHRHALVVYLADPRTPEWSARCFREADVMLLVGADGLDASVGQLERRLLPEGHRLGGVELVLLHEGAATTYQHTAQWLTPRRVRRHHHVRREIDADYARLARFLLGRAVGLVLSGGGARGFAHIGALATLIDRGWPIDCIGGASMGAIVGAQYAVGRPPADIRHLCRQEFLGRKDRDLTLPIASLNSARATVAKMRRLYGHWCIEDLPVPYFCMTTNLSRAQSVVHDRGPLWLWVRTSCAIPGLAPPVPHDGDLLVDGGLLNNLPADIMRERCGTVIGVDVTAGVDLRWHGESRPTMSGWALLRERWTRTGAPPFPTIVEILERTALAACIRDAASMRAECDVCITPGVEAYGMAAFTDIDAIIRAGAEAAAETLDGWGARPPR